MEETFYGIILALKTTHPHMFLQTNDAIKQYQYSTKTKYILLISFHEEFIFLETAVPCGSENSHNVVKLNPDEDKYYLLTPYPTLIQPLKSFHLKVLEPLPETQISFYTRSAYTMNQIYNTTFVHNNVKNYSQKRTQYNENQ